jgi:hypothetical protein
MDRWDKANTEERLEELVLSLSNILSTMDRGDKANTKDQLEELILSLSTILSTMDRWGKANTEEQLGELVLSSLPSSQPWIDGIKPTLRTNSGNWISLLYHPLNHG